MEARWRNWLDERPGVRRARCVEGRLAPDLLGRSGPRRPAGARPARERGEQRDPKCRWSGSPWSSRARASGGRRIIAYGRTGAILRRHCRWGDGARGGVHLLVLAVHGPGSRPQERRASGLPLRSPGLIPCKNAPRREMSAKAPPLVRSRLRPSRGNSGSPAGRAPVVSQVVLRGGLVPQPDCGDEPGQSSGSCSPQWLRAEVLIGRHGSDQAQVGQHGASKRVISRPARSAAGPVMAARAGQRPLSQGSHILSGGGPDPQ